MASVEPPVLEPLSLLNKTDVLNETAATDGESVSTKEFDSEDDHVCCMCDLTFRKEAEQDLLRHLLTIHKLVFGDVKLIANLKEYLLYWKKRFKEKELSEFCAVIKTNSLDTDPEPSEFYNLLCDALPEDKELRVKLQQQKLEEVIAQQQKERNDLTFSRGCLFCKSKFEGNRSVLFDHMIEEHSFSVGRPDNLVYVNEYLDILQKMLESSQCLYCEKFFTDRHVLKEHMRKKQHRMINPQNHTYDKFYIVNYLELGKNWQTIQKEIDIEIDDASDNESVKNEDWSDWNESVGVKAVCLFCDVSSEAMQTLIKHMQEVHGYSLVALKHEYGLDFYQQVKLVNFIRRQVHQGSCMKCQCKFGTSSDLLEHLHESDHLKGLPNKSSWDQPQYFFPTYEDDTLLCGLDDEDEALDVAAVNEESSNVSLETLVIAEDLPLPDCILKAEVVHAQLLN